MSPATWREAGIAGIGREIVLVGGEIADVDVGGGDRSFDEGDVDEIAPDREGVADRVALGGAQRLELALLRGIDLGGEVEEGVGDRADPGARRRVAGRAVPGGVGPGQLLDDLLEREDRLAVSSPAPAADDVPVMVVEAPASPDIRHPEELFASLISLLTLAAAILRARGRVSQTLSRAIAPSSPRLPRSPAQTRARNEIRFGNASSSSGQVARPSLAPWLRRD